MAVEPAARKRTKETDRIAYLKRILLVEDDRGVQEALGLFLKDSFEVLSAITGAEALAVLNCKEIAVIVLDYRLPDCTGLEVLTEIKATHPAIPVVMITGCGSESVCASALKLGVRDYFSKPFNPFDLVSSVRRIVSGPSPTREARLNLRPHKPSRDLLASGLIRHDLTIQKAINLIQQRYWDDLSLSRVSDELKISKYHLSHRFKGVMGMTFREYLTTLRLEKAKELLPSRHLSVTEVAQTVGFSDLPRFDKVFKRHTGVTPSSYRAQVFA